MWPVRILLTGVSASLRAAVHETVRGDPGLIVVGEPLGEIEPLIRVRRRDVDVVIVGMSGSTLPPVVERLVDEYPDVGVIAIDHERDEALLYRLRPRWDRVASISTDGLAAVIRRTAERVA